MPGTRVAVASIFTAAQGVGEMLGPLLSGGLAALLPHTEAVHCIRAPLAVKLMRLERRRCNTGFPLACTAFAATLLLVGAVSLCQGLICSEASRSRAASEKGDSPDRRDGRRRHRVRDDGAMDVRAAPRAARGAADER